MAEENAHCEPEATGVASNCDQKRQELIEKEVGASPCGSIRSWWKHAIERHGRRLRWITLATACLSMTVDGQDAFTIYHDAVKSHFNYTEITMQYYLAATEFGNAFNGPAGYLHDRYGPRLPNFIGILFLVGTLLPMIDATSKRAFYHQNSWLFIVYGLLIGSGPGFNYIPAIGTTIANFPSHYKALQVVCSTIWLNVGMFVFSELYKAFFIRGHTKDPGNQDLHGFLWLWLVYGIIACSLATLAAEIYPIHEDAREAAVIEMEAIGEDASRELTRRTLQAEEVENVVVAKKSAPHRDSSQCSQGTKVPAERRVEQTSGASITDEEKMALLGRAAGGRHSHEHCHAVPWEDYKHLDLYVLIAFFTGSTSVVSCVYMNLASYLRAFHHERHTPTLAVLTPICMITGKLTIPLLSDFLRLPRMTYLLVVNLFLWFSILLFVMFTDTLWIIYAVVLMSSANDGITWSITPAIVSEKFRLEHFGKNFGIIVAVRTVVTVCMMFAFGLFYNAAIAHQGQLYCYGEHCFAVHNLLLLAMSSIAVICAFTFLMRNRAQNA